ncbi:MAG: thioredoxin domain-containing protein [Deltaproteobacteria bacterium]|nr:thioredoxin domain-containing protein [Deltaproteobacteria bacterium]
MRTISSLLTILTVFCIGFSGNICFAKTELSLSAEIKVEKPPKDMAVTPDGKYIFILTDDSNVSVFTGSGILKERFAVGDGITRISVDKRGDKIYLMNSNKRTVEVVHVDFIEKIDTEGSPFKGPEDAPVTIVEFSDFQCPYCSKLPPVLEKVLAKNPKTVKIVFKNYPLSFHKFAKKAAIAAMAADGQGKFWEFYDYLFKNQTKLSKMDFNKVAEKLGLDVEKFKEDMDTAGKKVKKDMADGREIGVSGTPSLYIEGRKVRKRNESSIQKMINKALARQKSKK